jgi:hypothetical protein
MPSRANFVWVLTQHYQFCYVAACSNHNRIPVMIKNSFNAEVVYDLGENSTECCAVLEVNPWKYMN